LILYFRMDTVYGAYRSILTRKIYEISVNCALFDKSTNFGTDVD